jgi:hypothetical protein
MPSKSLSPFNTVRPNCLASGKTSRSSVVALGDSAHGHARASRLQLSCRRCSAEPQLISRELQARQTAPLRMHRIHAACSVFPLAQIRDDDDRPLESCASWRIRCGSRSTDHVAVPRSIGAPDPKGGVWLCVGLSGPREHGVWLFAGWVYRYGDSNPGSVAENHVS